MSFRPSNSRLFVLLLAGVSLAAGCRPQEQIARYTVPKARLVDPTLGEASAVSVPQRTLGAILSVGQSGWFFKLTGNPEQVAPHKDAFLAFVKSLKFEGQPDPQPKWTIPSEWKEQPGSGLRFATIVIPAEPKPLELTVTPLAKMGDETAFVLSNVNRWRDQLGLAAIGAEGLADHTEQLKVGDVNVTVVDIRGESTGGGMPGAPLAPFASGGGLPAIGSGPPQPESDGVAFEKPAHWLEGEKNSFRKAAFTVADGGKQVEVTVIDLSDSPLLENVNRWRGQIGLDSTTPEELAKTAQKLDVAGKSADYVTLVGPEETILGVVAPQSGRTWFIKLKGNSALAKREQPHFESFVKSLKFE